MSNSFFTKFVALSLVRNQTCKNFAELARRGYYNNVVFHRVIAVCHANILWGRESFTSLLRTLWHSQAILLAPEEAELVSMAIDCMIGLNDRHFH
jgi:hypothetical protein